MGKRELLNRLKEIEMSPHESSMYEKIFSKVKTEVAQLRLIFESAESRQHERQWLKNKTSGELDDNKIVDGMTGEQLIYKKRGVIDPLAGIQQLPKRLYFLVDISGSMYRFNGINFLYFIYYITGLDKRLERMLEVSTMIMEALIGFETRFEWCMTGHSGDGIIPLVEYGRPPKNEAERLKVLKKMSAHSQYCNSGDSTVFATKEALRNLPSLPADEHLFFVFSDANFKRYDIDPIEFGKLLVSEPKVTAYALFIASMEQEAKDIVSHFPQNAFLCMETSQLPHQFKMVY